MIDIKYKVIFVALVVTVFALLFVGASLVRLYEMDPPTEYMEVGDNLVPITPHAEYYQQERFLLNKGGASAYGLLIALWVALGVCLALGWKPWGWKNEYAQVMVILGILFFVYGIFSAG